MRFFLFCALLFLCTAPVFAQNAPRVAVWNPERSASNSRFTIDADYLNKVASWLEAAKIPVVRLTAQQISDPAQFSADKFDALMLEGSALPEKNIEAYSRFLDGGGVLIALASPNAFEIKIAQDETGNWQLSPPKNYFWQTTAIHNALGIHFNTSMTMAASGVFHTPSPLFKRYLPQALPLKRSLVNRWFIPKGGEIYPLVRSQMAGEGDYTPQMWVVANGNRRAIISASRLFTDETNSKVWPHGRETVVALARLAKDLRDLKVDLAGQLTVTTPTEPVINEPLQMRVAVGSVEPEGAKPLARWGQFDGSRLELSPIVAERATVSVAVGQSTIPGGLAAGATLDLAIPALGDGPRFLRIRGAYDRAGAALTASLGGSATWSEEFVYRESGGEVNLGHEYGGVPTEFTRIAFLAPSDATTLRLHNPGSAPIYFDAIQIESRTRPAPTMVIGLHTGVELAYDRKTALTPETTKNWTIMRATSRTWWVGPPEDPARWERFDKHVARYFALHPNVQLIFEGTPQWAAFSPQRYKDGGRRQHMTPPDNAKFREMAARIVQKYAPQVHAWEIWNEANVRHYWQGTATEYADLFDAIAPVIRKYDPKAPIIVAGFAGTTKGSIDPFLNTLVERGVTAEADLLAFHAYSPNGTWDVPYSLFEGHLFSLGGNTEIYANEQGYGFENGETQQAIMTDIGMARLMANGVAKVTPFNGGGDANSYGLIDETGRPRAAYSIFTDYLELARNGARRLDVALTSTDGGPQRGVYAAASASEDGTVTLVVNPADVERLRPALDANEEFTTNARWNVFFGTAKYANGQVVVTPLTGKQYAGFFKKAILDPAVFPTIEVAVPQSAGKWSLQLKFAGGETLDVPAEPQNGMVRFDYAQKLKNRERREAEISFRVTGATTIDAVRFPRSNLQKAAPGPALVRLKVPLPSAKKYAATTRNGDTMAPLSVKFQTQGGQSWAEFDLSLTGRTVVKLAP